MPCGWSVLLLLWACIRGVEYRASAACDPPCANPSSPLWVVAVGCWLGVERFRNCRLNGIRNDGIWRCWAMPPANFINRVTPGAWAMVLTMPGSLVAMRAHQ